MYRSGPNFEFGEKPVYRSGMYRNGHVPNWP